ncbi:MAG: NAD(+) synthase [Chloroflexi bacterium]|nr:NAD(+) synthase [Chloroflexota bacterium]|tara:strand:- start:5543 stop:6274 length:732 start_codon:yes stop_codon:yes gene_type:complete
MIDIEKIINWIKEYAITNNRKSLVIGISGGIDSAVVSTLCAKTNLSVHVASMPIKQLKTQHDLSMAHGKWLLKKYSNVTHHIIDLSKTYDTFYTLMKNKFNSEHSFANTKSRIRMITLHQISGATDGIVVGTGNKVEDFGIGFYTKYGDGGVDISPIADLMKSEVWNIGKKLGILQEIIDAPPTDGLWEDGRTDSDQLDGLTYEQLEDAMENPNSKHFRKYSEIRNPNLHKMNPIPIFKKQKN